MKNRLNTPTQLGLRNQAAKPKHALVRNAATGIKHRSGRVQGASKSIAIALVAAFLVSNAIPAISSTEVTENYDFESATTLDDEFTLYLGDNTVSADITRQADAGVTSSAGVRIDSSLTAKQAILATKNQVHNERRTNG